MVDIDLAEDAAETHGVASVAAVRSSYPDGLLAYGGCGLGRGAGLSERLAGHVETGGGLKRFRLGHAHAS
ncbi:hypothetical protein [Streptomyces hypolithicus]